MFTPLCPVHACIDLFLDSTLYGVHERSLSNSPVETMRRASDRHPSRSTGGDQRFFVLPAISPETYDTGLLLSSLQRHTTSLAFILSFVMMKRPIYFLLVLLSICISSISVQGCCFSAEVSSDLSTIVVVSDTMRIKVLLSSNLQMILSEKRRLCVYS